jgi:two-component system OmpR family sensor kinase
VSRGSLVARVARAAVTMAALGAAVTGVISTYAADRMLTAGLDTRLRGAALALADELRAGASDQVVRAEVEEDGRELAASGLTLAVYDGRGLLAGDARTPFAPGGCGTVLSGDRRVRRCAERGGSLTVVVAGAVDPLRAQVRTFAEAAALGVLITVLGGLAVGRRLAARAVAPLVRLRTALGTVSAEAPGAARLGEAEGWEEVDALRGVLQQLLQELDLALARARRFAADAAHELRTPVATMRAELELLAEEPQLASAQATLGRVHHTLLATSALIERLLILALPARSASVERLAVAMADVVREAIEALPAASRARVTVSPSDEGLVRGDATLLRALVDNALDNALKFGAPHPVECQVAAEGARVLVTVADQGPGVPVEDRQRVFEPFYRTSAARASAVRGHGIGLALIAHVAAGHGGQAAFVAADRGARLELALPAWRPAP